MRFRSPEDLALSKHAFEASLYGVPDAERLGLMNPGRGKAVGNAYKGAEALVG